ncbi:helicase associated domain-containing protein [Yinghuangia aomiensis]
MRAGAAGDTPGHPAEAEITPARHSAADTTAPGRRPRHLQGGQYPCRGEQPAQSRGARPPPHNDTDADEVFPGRPLPEIRPTAAGYPLGIWINRQRTAYAAGTLTGLRVQRLEGLGMIWNPTDAAFDDGLAAARQYYADHGTLAAPDSWPATPNAPPPSPRSTQTGTRPGRWTGSATTRAYAKPSPPERSWTSSCRA